MKPHFMSLKQIMYAGLLLRVMPELISTNEKMDKMGLSLITASCLTRHLMESPVCISRLTSC